VHFLLIFIYKTNFMHKLQTNLKIWSYSTPTCFGTSVLSSGISHTKFKEGLPKNVVVVVAVKTIF